MKKRYKAIFFDWDGTAVRSRKAPVDDAVVAMRPLLENGVYLAIISGTTYENIAGCRTGSSRKSSYKTCIWGLDAARLIPHSANRGSRICCTIAHRTRTY